MIVPDPLQIPSTIYCGQSNNTINLFDASIFIRPFANYNDQPQFLKSTANQPSKALKMEHASLNLCW
jgi:hypothetical protein